MKNNNNSNNPKADESSATMEQQTISSSLSSSNIQKKIACSTDKVVDINEDNKEEQQEKEVKEVTCDGEIFPVERILEKRPTETNTSVRKRKHPKKRDDEDVEYLYLVKWEGYDNEHNTWEPRENLEAGAKGLLDQFEKHEKRKKQRRKPNEAQIDVAEVRLRLYKESKAEFEREKEKTLNNLDDTTKNDFREVGFGKWNKRWLPMIQLSPYDVSPGAVRDQWLGMFNKTKSEPSRLVYFYGSPHDDLSLAYTMLSKSNIKSYEAGVKMNLHKCPSYVQKKLDSNKKMSSIDLHFVEGLPELEVERNKTKENRLGWVKVKEDYEEILEKSDAEIERLQNEGKRLDNKICDEGNRMNSENKKRIIIENDKTKPLSEIVKRRRKDITPEKHTQEIEPEKNNADTMKGNRTDKKKIPRKRTNTPEKKKSIVEQVVEQMDDDRKMRTKIDKLLKEGTKPQSKKVKRGRKDITLEEHTQEIEPEKNNADIGKGNRTDKKKKLRKKINTPEKKKAIVEQVAEQMDDDRKMGAGKEKIQNEIGNEKDKRILELMDDDIKMRAEIKKLLKEVERLRHENHDERKKMDDERKRMSEKIDNEGKMEAKIERLKTENNDERERLKEERKRMMGQVKSDKKENSDERKRINADKKQMDNERKKMLKQIDDDRRRLDDERRRMIEQVEYERRRVDDERSRIDAERKHLDDERIRMMDQVDNERSRIEVQRKTMMEQFGIERKQINGERKRLVEEFSCKRSGDESMILRTEVNNQIEEENIVGIKIEEKET